MIRIKLETCYVLIKCLVKTVEQKNKPYSNRSSKFEDVKRNFNFSFHIFNVYTHAYMQHPHCLLFYSKKAESTTKEIISDCMCWI